MTDQDYKAFKQAPPVTASLFEEAVPTLYMSKLIYPFTNIIKKCQDDKLDLDIPEDFPVKNVERFLEDSIDLTEYGNGVSFFDMINLIEHNKDVLEEAQGLGSASLFDRKIIDQMKNHHGDDGLKKLYLTHCRSIRQRVTCVYSVTKDTDKKQIVVSFRGSAGVLTTRDWQTNFNALPVKLRTPEKIKEKMEGVLKERVLVHRGIYNYLFNNRKTDGKERYDEIVEDIVAAIGNDDGYSICVTGHSLGGGLATMFSFILAGTDKPKQTDETKFPNFQIPKPITCITFASLMSGTTGYRTATEQLEKDGLLRALRINNREDIVPCAFPFSLSFFRPRLMKHVGMYLRLTSSGCSIQHSSKANCLTACRNSPFKPVWHIMTYHLLPIHEERMNTTSTKEQLKGLKLDDLYRDENYVSLDFIGGSKI